MSAQPAIDPQPLLHRARSLLQSGQTRPMRPVLAALQRLMPSTPEIDELEARLLLGEGRLADALAVLDRGLAAVPDAVALLLCRADARLRDGAVAAAASDAAEAVMLDRGNARAKAILGIILIELGQVADARVCLAEAVAAEPASAQYRQGLAEALERLGEPVGAAAALCDGIALQPANVALRIAAVMTAMRQRDFAAAAALAEAARHDGVADACVFGLLGHALSNLGRHAEAVEAYGEAARLAPEDQYVRHLVSAAGVLPSEPRAPAAYVETLFDGYADRFEAHLIGLGYRVPGLMRKRLLAHVPAVFSDGPVLDLGCGTGLIGVALSDLALRPLVGVDLSAPMLRHAAAKGVYDELLQADVETVLNDPGRRWKLVIAADVLCYFGALDALLKSVHDRLEPGGLLLFSVELLAGGPTWALGAQGRYAHARRYVEQAVAQAGLVLRDIGEEVLRNEAEAGVPGLLVVAQRTRLDG